MRAIQQAEAVPQLTLDCVIFGFHEGHLKVLLVRWKGTQYWSLPGGVVRKTESLDDSATRILRQRTGLAEIFLKQFYTFGATNRYDTREIARKLVGVIPEEYWYERAISVGYYALVDFAHVFPNPDDMSDACQWHGLESVPQLLFDHHAILEKALECLRRELSYQPIGLNLLPEKFTMPEMLRMYEAILARKIDPRNFQKKILNSGIVVKHNEVRKGKAHKAPNLYSFDRERYFGKLESGGLFFV